jgi:hypothetical protein
MHHALGAAAHADLVAAGLPAACIAALDSASGGCTSGRNSSVGGGSGGSGGPLGTAADTSSGTGASGGPVANGYCSPDATAAAGEAGAGTAGSLDLKRRLQPVFINVQIVQHGETGQSIVQFTCYMFLGA